MTYTLGALLAVSAVLVLDTLLLRTRLVRTRQWWTAYAVVAAFQLLTNGWLTGRGIVTYDPQAVIGVRVAFAPVEDLAFGFALVLATCALWVWQDPARVSGAGHSLTGPRRPPGRPGRPGCARRRR